MSTSSRTIDFTKAIAIANKEVDKWPRWKQMAVASALSGSSTASSPRRFVDNFRNVPPSVSSPVVRVGVRNDRDRNREVSVGSSIVKTISLVVSDVGRLSGPKDIDLKTLLELSHESIIVFDNDATLTAGVDGVSLSRTNSVPWRTEWEG